MLGRRPAEDNEEGYKTVNMFVKPALWRRLRVRVADMPGYTLRLAVEDALDLWLSQAPASAELDKLTKP